LYLSKKFEIKLLPTATGYTEIANIPNIIVTTLNKKIYLFFYYKSSQPGKLSDRSSLASLDVKP
jgi:hypothetical protein